MSPSVERVVERLREAQEDFAGEVEQQQRRWRYRLRRGQIWFDSDTS